MIKKCFVIIFLLGVIQVCSAVDQCITLDGHPYIQITDFPHKETEQVDSLDLDFVVNNSSADNWFFQSGSWTKVEISAFQKDSCVYRGQINWESEDQLIYHAYGERRSVLHALTLPKGESKLHITLCCPLENSYPHDYNVGLGTEDFFNSKNDEMLNKIIFVCAILIGFGLYNLLLFAFVRDYSFLVYFFVQLLFTCICLVGFAYLPFSLRQIVAFDGAVTMLFVGFYLLFVTQYLNTSETDSRWYKVARIQIIGNISLGVLMCFLTYYPETLIYNIISAYSIFLCPGLAFFLLAILITRRLLNRDKLAYGFAVVLFVMLILTMVTYFTNLGFLPQNPLNNYAIGIGMLIESVAFSAVLAYRLRFLKTNLEKKMAEIELTSAEKDLIKKELDLKESELIGKMATLAKKNELLSNIKARINLPDQEVTTKKEVLALINNDLAHDDQWEHFQIKFNTLHRDFVDNLKKEYPQLSLTDMKLCVLMKLNLSSKEIAGYLNIQPRSIAQSKYRMKKKMDLSPTIDVGDFVRTYQ